MLSDSAIPPSLSNLVDQIGSRHLRIARLGSQVPRKQSPIESQNECARALGLSEGYFGSCEDYYSTATFPSLSSRSRASFTLSGDIPMMRAASEKWRSPW